MVESGFEPKTADSELTLVTGVLGQLTKREHLHARSFMPEGSPPVMKWNPPSAVLSSCLAALFTAYLRGSMSNMMAVVSLLYPRFVFRVIGGFPVTSTQGVCLAGPMTATATTVPFLAPVLSSLTFQHHSTF